MPLTDGGAKASTLNSLPIWSLPISRSTAAAYILLCDRHGQGMEAEIASALRNRAPHACPNPLMIRIADAMLERDGRMIDAIQGIGRGSIVALGERVELPLALAEL